MVISKHELYDNPANESLVAEFQLINSQQQNNGSHSVIFNC
jgi:hypothetical protein